MKPALSTVLLFLIALVTGLGCGRTPNANDHGPAPAELKRVIEWVQNTDRRIDQLSFIISFDYKTDPRILLAIEQQLPQINVWINELPAKERNKLQLSCSAFVAAVIERSVETNSNLARLEGYPIEPSLKVRTLIETLSTIPSLKRQWDHVSQAMLVPGRIIPAAIKGLPPGIELNPSTGLLKNSSPVEVERIRRMSEYLEFLKKYALAEKIYRAKAGAHYQALLGKLFGKGE